MSTYMEVFKLAGMTHSVDLPDAQALSLARWLMKGDSIAPNGSSFVISAEPALGMKRVYLSRVSVRRIHARQYEGLLARLLEADEPDGD